jgi:hypothetical protein
MTAPMNGADIRARTEPEASPMATPGMTPNPNRAHVALARVFERVNSAGQLYLIGRVARPN